MQLSAAAGGVSEASCIFVQSLAEKPDKAEVNKLAGFVFQRCQELGKAATDNRTAVGRKFVKVTKRFLRASEARPRAL